MQTKNHTDIPTVLAIGVLAATTAAFWHETVGHGTGCAIDGGRIIILTSIFFKCRGATALTDAAGPFASLIAGLVTFALLARRPFAPPWHLFLVLFGGIGLFWFSGQLIFHALLNRDDWFAIARQLGWSSVWRPIACICGIACYAASIWIARWTAAGWGRTIRPAYAAGVVSAAIAGAMWAPAPLKSAIEGFETLGVLPLGLLLAARGSGTAPLIARSWAWIAVALLVFGAFALVQGRGI